MIAWSTGNEMASRWRTASVIEMMKGNPKLRAASATVVAVLSLLPLAARAQNNVPSAAGSALSSGFRFSEQSGEELFANVCRACHMSDGKGATGAGTYPSLARDQALKASRYPIEIVINGRHGMPPFGAMMSDDQIAAVVNYLRTHFGNNYRDAVTSEDVKAARR
jgi:mono/diheme cytochrome c family protein